MDNNEPTCMSPEKESEHDLEILKIKMWKTKRLEEAKKNMNGFHMDIHDSVADIKDLVNLLYDKIVNGQ